MATPAVIVVITVAVLTLVVLGGTVLVLLTHLRELAGTVGALRDEIGPQLATLQEASEVTRVELERVSDAASDLRSDDDRSSEGRVTQGYTDGRWTAEPGHNERTTG